MTATPPGWYPDPQDQSIVRWWDGQQWTGHTQPRVTSPPSQGPAAEPVTAARRAKPKLFGKGQALGEAQAENDRLRAELARLGAMEIADLRSERDRLQAEVETTRADIAEAARKADQQRARAAAEPGLLGLQVRDRGPGRTRPSGGGSGPSLRPSVDPDLKQLTNLAQSAVVGPGQ